MHYNHILFAMDPNLLTWNRDCMLTVFLFHVLIE